VTSSFQGGRRYPPHVFTENGVAMLSGVLNSDRALAVNIAIMRTFTQLRSLLSGNESLSERMAKLEKGTDKLFRIKNCHIERMNILVYGTELFYIANLIFQSNFFSILCKFGSNSFIDIIQSFKDNFKHFICSLFKLIHSIKNILFQH